MKITQFTAVKNGEYTNFYGIDEENQVYSYSWKTGKWRLFKATKED